MRVPNEEIIAWLEADPTRKPIDAERHFRDRDPTVKSNAIRQLLFRVRRGSGVRPEETKIGPKEKTPPKPPPEPPETKPPHRARASRAASPPPEVEPRTVTPLHIVPPPPANAPPAAPPPERPPRRPPHEPYWRGGSGDGGTDPLAATDGWDRAKKIRRILDDGLAHLAAGDLTARDRRDLAASLDVIAHAERTLIESEQAAQRIASNAPSDPSTPEGRAALLADLKKLPRALLFEALGMDLVRKAQ